MSTPVALRVGESFRSLYQVDPDGVWSAPGRVNLIGEHTDYNDGFVLPFAIQYRTAVAVRTRNDREVSVTSPIGLETITRGLDDLTPESLSGWSAYPLGVLWSLRDQIGAAAKLTGLDIVIDTDVPIGAGLSSSAAIECAVAVAVNDLWQLGLHAPTLARVCQRAENVAVGAPTGIMDQSVSLMSRADHALFLDCRTLATDHIPLSFRQDGLALLVMDSTVRHSNASGEYGARRASCEKAAAALGVPALRDATVEDLIRLEALVDEETLRRARHIITENERVLETVRVLRESGPRAIGPLLTASHVSMRDDFEISCLELDHLVDAALEVGALGARMTGGGFGGAAIALVAVDEVARVIQEVSEHMSSRGLPIPRCEVVHPGPGASAEN